MASTFRFAFSLSPLACVLVVSAVAVSARELGLPPGGTPQKITRAIGPEWPLEVDLPTSGGAAKDDTGAGLLRQASALVGQSKFAEALPLLQRAEKLDPKNYEVELLLGYVLQKVGKLNDSIDAYRRALALQANNARGHSGLCSTLLANDRRGDAVDECRKAVELAPDSVRYKAQLARLYMIDNRIPETIQLMQAALSRRPSDVSTLGTLGDLYMLAGQFAQAAGVYETIARDHPDISVVYLRLTAAYDYLDRPVDSIAAAKKFVAMEPQLLLGQLILGDALKDGGFFDESIEPLKKAANDPRLASQAYVSLSAAYKMIPDPEREVDALRHAFTAEPNNFPIAYALAESLLYQHESQEAIKVYQVARKLDPNYPDVLLGLGQAYIEVRRYDEGVDLIEEALRIRPLPPNMQIDLSGIKRRGELLSQFDELLAESKKNPSDVNVLRSLAAAYDYKGMDKEIEETDLQIIKVEPDNYQNYNRMYIFYEEHKEYAKALEYVRKVIEMHPHHVVMLGEAWVLQKLNRPDEAIEAMKKAEEMKPDSLDVHMMLGDAYQKRARRNEALAEFQSAFQISSGDVRPNFRLAWLYIRMGNKEGAIRHYKILKGLVPDQVQYLERCILAHWGTLE